MSKNNERKITKMISYSEPLLFIQILTLPYFHTFKIFRSSDSAKTTSFHLLKISKISIYFHKSSSCIIQTCQSTKVVSPTFAKRSRRTFFELMDFI